MSLPLEFNPKKSSWLKKPLALYLTVIFIFVALTGGILIGWKVIPKVNNQQVVNPADLKYGQVSNKNQPLPDYLKKDLNFNLFWDVWQKIQDNYVDQPVGETKLLYGAMSGLVSALGDPYSVFLPPEPAKEFSDDLKGKFEGIGAELAMRDNLITVVSPLLESPAEKAGLKPGDRITAVNGESTENMTLNEAVSKIRGKKGTVVILKIYREKDNKFYDISITRDTIKVVSVKFEMKENDIAYLQITNFNEDTDERFRKAVNEILLKNPKGIILDMRNNPGGYLDRSITIASYWLPVGQVVVQEEFSANDKKQYLANGGAQLKDIPTIVLVNGGSASASEIVAGALRDNGKAKLVGEKTFGKGSVQSLEELSDGSAVKLTVARWLTPKGEQINVVGLQPDEVVELTEDNFNKGEDPQLDKAMEMLKK